MERIVSESIFLLEFLIDELKIQSCPMDGLCVSMQFLDNDPLELCENDLSETPFGPSPGKDFSKTGKSCLFFLRPDQLEECLETFDLFVCVVKKLQPHCKPDRLQIGSAVISIANMFNALVTEVQKNNCLGPISKTLRDNFDIQGIQDGSIIGTLGIYIRMSCFGKLIVTQFQMNLQDKSVLFKDEEGKSVYKYKKLKKSKKEPQQDDDYPLGGDFYQNMGPPPSPPQFNPGNYCPPCGNTTPYNEEPEQFYDELSDDDPGDFREFGACIGENELIIRIIDNDEGEESPCEDDGGGDASDPCGAQYGPGMGGYQTPGYGYPPQYGYQGEMPQYGQYGMSPECQMPQDIDECEPQEPAPCTCTPKEDEPPCGRKTCGAYNARFVKKKKGKKKLTPEELEAKRRAEEEKRKAEEEARKALRELLRSQAGGASVGFMEKSRGSSMSDSCPCYDVCGQPSSSVCPSSKTFSCCPSSSF